ncbi:MULTISPECIES: hypothetical protein [unclassified Gillisia]|uniref:hypothetical protein n=1 Tax=unclassified Gillisia TaxID=2615025 RepID=UPI0012E09FD4|nr:MULTISPECIES: hypothetical protein [unclassified Gillisia]
MKKSLDTYEILILKQIVYLYYPSNLSATKKTDDYIKTQEFINLKASINSSSRKENLEKLENEISVKFNEYKFQKVSLDNWLDRAECYWLDIIVENNLLRYKLQLSKLIPYFTLFLTEVNLDSDNRIFESPPKIITENQYSQKSKDLVTNLSEYIKVNFGLKPFNLSWDNYILEDISFQDFDFGNFTLYNAFFSNNLKY